MHLRPHATSRSGSIAPRSCRSPMFVCIAAHGSCPTVAGSSPQPTGAWCVQDRQPPSCSFTQSYPSDQHTKIIHRNAMQSLDEAVRHCQPRGSASGSIAPRHQPPSPAINAAGEFPPVAQPSCSKTLPPSHAHHTYRCPYGIHWRTMNVTTGTDGARRQPESPPLGVGRLPHAVRCWAPAWRPP